MLIKKAIEKRANELGVDFKTKQKLTSYLTKAATNGNIETVEVDAIGKNAKAQQIITEIKNSEAWAEDLNTQLSSLEKTENVVQNAITFNTAENSLQGDSDSDIINNNQDTGVDIDAEQQDGNSNQRIGREVFSSESQTGAIQETNGGIYENSSRNNWGAQSTLRNQRNNRRIEFTPEQKEGLKTTAIKDGNGNPKEVSHFTDNMDFETFAKGDIGFHFGSESQAQQHKKNLKKQNRLNSEGRIIRAHLAIKNPIRVSSDIMCWWPAHTALRLYADGVIDFENYLSIYNLQLESGHNYDSPAAVELRKILDNLGYDGIVYQNNDFFEGEGESYIAFYPEQVIIIDDGKTNNQADPQGPANFMPENDTSGSGKFGLSEPTDQEIYRDPTAEENAEAIFGRRKSAKQRHIIDVAKKLDSNMKVVFVDKNSKSLNGKNGKYNRDTNTMYIAKDLETNDIKLVEAYVEVFKHEFVHRLELRKAYKSFKNYLFNKSVAFEKYAKARLYYIDRVDADLTREDAINALVDMYVENSKGDLNLTREQAEREAVADFVARTLFKDKSKDFLQAIEDKNIYDKENGTGFAQMETDLEFFEEMASTDRTLLQKIIDAIRDLINSIKGITNLEKDLQYLENRLTRVYESADNKKTATESGEVYKNNTEVSTENSDVSFSNDNITKVQREQKDIIRSIGEKSINNLSKEELDALRPMAEQYWDEMKEKSPLFRAWFGDWRFHDKSKIAIANIPGNKRGLVKNKDTSWDINVSAQVFNENKIHKNKISREAKPYMPYIQDIIEKAVLLDSWGMGDLKSENSLLMHSLYAIADIGNGPELLKLYVEEMNDPNNPKTLKRAYKLNNIESQQLSVVGSQNSVSPITSTAGIKTISDLFAVVKQKDKSFNPKPSSAVVNSDGKPLVVYHGTDAQFSEFDISQQRTSGKLNFGKGIYLTPNRNIAEMYSNTGNVMELFAVVKKPYEIFSTRFDNNDLQKLLSEFGEEVTLDNVDKVLQKNGYDGIIARTYNGTTNPINQIVVFKNTQVKSATDNIGTFDSENADIYYSSDDLSALQRDLYDRHKNGEITNEEYLEETDRLWGKANETFGAFETGEIGYKGMVILC